MSESHTLHHIRLFFKTGGQNLVLAWRGNIAAKQAFDKLTTARAEALSSPHAPGESKVEDDFGNTMQVDLRDLACVLLSNSSQASEMSNLMQMEGWRAMIHLEGSFEKDSDLKGKFMQAQRRAMLRAQLMNAAMPGGGSQQ